MRYLIDTHIFLWWLNDDEKISPKVYNIIKDPQNTIFLSTASLWEIVIKKNIGKLQFPDVKFPQLLESENFEELPINSRYLDSLNKLEKIHNDPFDRMIIAQAQTENMMILSQDKQILKYKVSVIS